MGIPLQGGGTGQAKLDCLEVSVVRSTVREKAIDIVVSSFNTRNQQQGPRGNNDIETMVSVARKWYRVQYLLHRAVWFSKEGPW